MTEPTKPILPEAATAPIIERQAPERRMRLSEMFQGDEYENVRDAIKRTGKFHSPRNGKTLHVQTRKIDGSDDHEVMAIAAISRDPGKTQDAIDLIQDFLDKTGSGQRSKQIRQYWEIYELEGLVNNAINKYASLLSGGGRAKVRKAKKGKIQKAIEIAQQVLDHWIENVNSPGEAGVATGSRGLKAVTEQGIRVALVEGNFIGRQVWVKENIEGVGQFALPMTIQTLSMEYMAPITELAGLGDFWYWTPPADLAKLIKGETGSLPKEVKEVVKKLVAKSGLAEDTNIVQQIKKEDRALLHPALLCHVKHRGSDRKPYGESFIEPAKLAIRFSRATTNADMVSMENVINQVMVVMVGSSDPESPYSKSDVAMARANLMQSFFEEPSPNMTIVWQGDDVKVEVVGAKENLPDFASRHEIGENKIIAALGIPTALLSGTTSDGKSAGWAAMISASGQAEHLGSAFAKVWTTICRRILLENGFTDIDVVFEFDKSLLADKNEERTQNRADYVAGLMSIRAYIASTGRDPDAEFIQKCIEKGLEPSTATWEEAFMPPQGLQGQGTPGEGEPAGPPGSGPGKQPGGKESETTPPAPVKKKTVVEKKTTVENK